MFTPEVIEVFKKQRIELLSQIDRLELELEECKTSVSALETLLRNEGHSILEDHFDMNRYPSDGNLTDKLIFLLNHGGESTAKNIAEEIIELDNLLGHGSYDTEESKDKLARTITLYASRLYNEGRIDARKVGNTNLYSVKSVK